MHVYGVVKREVALVVQTCIACRNVSKPVSSANGRHDANSQMTQGKPPFLIVYTPTANSCNSEPQTPSPNPNYLYSNVIPPPYSRNLQQGSAQVAKPYTPHPKPYTLNPKQ
jgi:hypothetical protein